jgi:O-antigen/teichoic acid export membrane protein
MFPKVAGLADNDAHRFTAQVCRNTLFITAFPSLGILLFGKVFIELLYGAAYLPACEALYLLIPGTMAMGVYKILTRNFISRNKQQVAIVAGLTGLVVNVGLNFILIPRIGIAGAALATTSSYTITSLILLFFFLKESDFRLRDLLLIRNSDFTQLFDLVNKVFPWKVRA